MLQLLLLLPLQFSIFLTVSANGWLIGFATAFAFASIIKTFDAFLSGRRSCRAIYKVAVALPVLLAWLIRARHALHIGSNAAKGEYTLHGRAVWLQ